MISILTDKIVNRLICQNIIANDDREIYQYGLERIFTILLNLVSILILSLIFGEIFKSIVFTVSFFVLREYSGGFHARTPVKCYLLTLASVALFLLIVKLNYINVYICFILLLVSSVTIFLYSPIGSENKPLDEIKKIIYKRKTIMIWAVEICISVLSYFLNISDIYISVICSHTLTAVALISSVIVTKKLC